MSATKKLIPLRMSPEMWERVQQAAREEGAKEGKGISASEWVRRAIAAKLKQHVGH